MGEIEELRQLVEQLRSVLAVATLPAEPVAPTIYDSMKLFLDSAAVNSPTTRASYATGLGHVMTVLQECGLKPLSQPASDVQPAHLFRMPDYLVARKYAKKSILAYLAGMTAWVRFCQLRDWIVWRGRDERRFDAGISQIRRAQKPAKRLVRAPSAEDVNRIIAAAWEVEAVTDLQIARRLRDIALVEFLRSTGARVAEAAALRRQDLATRAGADGEPLHVAIVYGKGSKERQVLLDTRAHVAVSIYTATAPAPADWPLFLQHRVEKPRPTPLDNKSIREIVRRLATRAGIPWFHPHLFRHYLATRMLDACGNVVVVQEYLGHESPATTTIYAELSPARIEEAHRKAFPETA